MAIIAAKDDEYGDKAALLERIKNDIHTSYMYQRENNKRFHDYRRYVFKTSISDAQRTILSGLKKPAIEANILPAYIARLMGEFAKHEPSIEVAPSEGVPVSQEVLDVVEGHIRHNIYEANKNGFSETIYQDILSGGLSAFKVYADYASPMSFNQNIFWERCFDPTLAGFDPMARFSHKGDGRYAFEIYPMTIGDFVREFPKADKSKIRFTRKYTSTAGNIEGFNWSYKDAQHQSILLVVEYFQKRKKRTKIVKLADNRTMTMKNYNLMVADWEEKGYIEQLPVIIGKPRLTDIETIWRLRINECEILSEEETMYTDLPIIAVSGGSIVLTQGTTNCTYEMTVPYIYHARGIQDLKNFSMQTLANSMENQVQSKFIIMKEALPQEQDYIDNITNIQDASVIVVNAFNENNPDQPINTPIREVMQVPLPVEVMQAFQMTDPTTQAILGSFASNLGRNDADLSGKAVIETATVGNSAAMPYMMGYLAAIKQGSNVTVNLMPRVLTGDRTIPVVTKHGTKEYKRVNGKGMPDINYETGAIQVNIEPGLSFGVQKSQAMSQITSLMEASQEFGAFMNSDYGLPILIENLNCRNQSELKEAIPKWLEQKQQQQQQAQQQQMQMMQQDPKMLKAQADIQKSQSDAQMNQMKMQIEQQQSQIDNAVAMAKLAIEKQLADAKVEEIESKIAGTHMEQVVKMTEMDVSSANHKIDAAAKMAEASAREHEALLNVHAAALKEHEVGLKHHASMLAEKQLEHDISEAKKEKKEPSK